MDKKVLYTIEHCKGQFFKLEINVSSFCIEKPKASLITVNHKGKSITLTHETWEQVLEASQGLLTRIGKLYENHEI
jgi:hypothetical protein